LVELGSIVQLCHIPSYPVLSQRDRPTQKLK
jgi:hypothetical protein